MRAALAPALDLAADPHAVGEPPAQRRVDGLGQLADGVRRHPAVVEIEVERHLTHGESLARQAPSSRTLSISPAVVDPEQLPVDRQLLLAAQFLDRIERPLELLAGGWWPVRRTIG